MSTSELRAGERVVDVSFDEHTISVDLADGRTIKAPLTWFPASCTPRRSNGKGGRSPAAAMGFIGRSWTKISAVMGCCAGHLRPATAA